MRENIVLEKKPYFANGQKDSGNEKMDRAGNLEQSDKEVIALKLGSNRDSRLWQVIPVENNCTFMGILLSYRRIYQLLRADCLLIKTINLPGFGRKVPGERFHGVHQRNNQRCGSKIQSEGKEHKRQRRKAGQSVKRLENQQTAGHVEKIETKGVVFKITIADIATQVLIPTP